MKKLLLLVIMFLSLTLSYASPSSNSDLDPILLYRSYVTKVDMVTKAEKTWRRNVEIIVDLDTYEISFYDEGLKFKFGILHITKRGETYIDFLLEEDNMFIIFDITTRELFLFHGDEVYIFKE